MLPSFRTGPVFVQKELYLIIFVGHLNLRQSKNSKSKKEHFSYKLPVLPGFLTKKQVSADNFFRGE